MTTPTTESKPETQKGDVSVLGQSVKLPSSGRIAPTRFMKAAMTEYQSSWDQSDVLKRGIPSEGLIKVYEEWGKGGFGIILSGNTIVDPINLEGPGNPIINSKMQEPERAAAFQAMAKGAKAHGSLFITQLSHGGRQVFSGLNPKPVSASDVQLADRMGRSFGKPTALDKAGIQEIIENFAFASEYAYKNGSDGVQLHAAHGYLLAQFLSTTTNQRTDEYGGPLENRARIIYEIFEEIKKRVQDPKFILAIKINSVEFQKGGFQPEECREVCKHLESLGVDVIELSGGTYEELAFSHKRESSKAREAFFLEFSDVIRAGVSKATIWTTGGFRTADAMVHAVKKGSTDGIGLGRPVTQDFALPRKLITGNAGASTPTLLDEQDFLITNVAAGTQMRQVAEGRKPFSQADQKDVQKFQQTVGAWMAEAAENGKKGIINAGFPQLDGPPYKPLSA